MSRLEFARKVRHAGDIRCKDACEQCGLPFNGKRREYHHILAANDGGDNTLENMLVLCVPCHQPHTRQYVVELRKAERIRDKRTGAAKRSGQALPFGKGSHLKRKLDGSVVPRIK